MKTNSYTSQLKGWAVDRAISVYAINKDAKPSADDLTKYAQALVEFCYNPDEEIETLQRELDKKMEDRQYNDEMAQAIAMKPASNSEAA